jgi:hypothetical protein
MFLAVVSLWTNVMVLLAPVEVKKHLTLCQSVEIRLGVEQLAACEKPVALVIEIV